MKPVTVGECIQAPGYRDRDGYAYRRVAQKKYSAHRLAYETEYGPIPPGLTIDHLCHNADLGCQGGPSCLHRGCINVRHLEAVPSAVNTGRVKGRRDRCPQGHLYKGPNLIVLRGKYKACRICMRASQRRGRARRYEANKKGPPSVAIH